MLRKQTLVLFTSLMKRPIVGTHDEQYLGGELFDGTPCGDRRTFRFCDTTSILGSAAADTMMCRNTRGRQGAERIVTTSIVGDRVTAETKNGSA